MGNDIESLLQKLKETTDYSGYMVEGDYESTTRSWLVATIRLLLALIEVVDFDQKILIEDIRDQLRSRYN